MEDRYFEAFINRLDACFKSRPFGRGGLNRRGASFVSKMFRNNL